MVLYFGPGVRADQHDSMPSAGQGGSTANADVLASRYGGTPSAGAGGAPSGPELVPVVYMGTKTDNRYASHWERDDILALKMRDYKPTTYHKVLSLTQALLRFDRMSFTEQRNMLRLLFLGGFGGAVNIEDIEEEVRQSTAQDAREAYKNLLVRASEIYMTTKRPATPDDVLRHHIGYRLGGLGIKWDGDLDAFKDGITKNILKAAAAGGEGGGLLDMFGEEEEPEPYTEVSRSKSIDYLNPMDAKGMTRAMLQQELGRDPTQAEYEDFLSALHAAERANPTTQVRTDKYGVNEVGDLYLKNTNTVTHGGMTSAGYEQLLREKAQSNPEWAEYQAMGYYFPALLSALGATVPGA